MQLLRETSLFIYVYIFFISPADIISFLFYHVRFGTPERTDKQEKNVVRQIIEYFFGPSQHSWAHLGGLGGGG